MHKLKRKSIMFSWLISYFIISLAALAVNVASYSAFEQKIAEKNNYYNLEVLNNVRQSFDNIFQNAANVAMRISNSENVQKAAACRVLDGKCREYMNQVNADLAAELNDEMYIRDIFVWLRNTDYIVGTSSGNTRENYLEIYGNYLGVESAQTREFLEKKHYLEYFSSGIENNGAQGAVTLMNSVYGVTFDEPVAAVVILIDYTAFMKNNALLGSDTGFYVVSVNGETLISSDGEKFTPEQIKQDESVRINNGRVLIKTESELTGCSVIRSYIKSEYMGDITRNRVLIYSILIVYMIICGVFIVFVINRNYSPIKALVAFIEKNVGNSARENDDENEINYIYSAMQQILEANNKAYDKLNAWSDIVKNNVIARLFKNVGLQSKSDMEIYARLEREFKNRNYILVACLNNVSDGVFPDDDLQGYDRERWAKLIVSNILGELFEGFGRDFVEVDGISYLILSANDENLTDPALAVFEKFFDAIREHFCFDVTFVMSDKHRTIESMAIAYNEVLSGIDSQFVIDSRIIMYKDISENEYNLYSFPTEKEVCLIAGLREMDSGKATAVVREVFEENINERHISTEAARSLMYMMVGMIMNVINKSDVVDGSDMLLKMDIFGRLSKCSNVYEMRGEIEWLIEEYCNAKSSEGASSQKEIANRIEQYVYENYSNCDLGGAMFESEFGMSYNYISKIFKRYKQVGLLNFITTVRIEKSKELLEHTEYTVNQIAQMVGYVNTRSFSRAFVKISGVAPGKYREISEEKRS